MHRIGFAPARPAVRGLASGRTHPVSGFAAWRGAASISVTFALAATVLAACGGAVATPTVAAPTAASSGSAAQSPSGSGGSPAPCAAASLVASGGPWGGAAGSRGADVTVVNHGSDSCLLPGGPAVAIVDAGGNVLVQSHASATGTRPLAPNGSAKFSVLFGNWCNTSVSLPLSLRLALLGGSATIDGLALASSDSLPPCNGPGEPASLSATDWQ